MHRAAVVGEGKRHRGVRQGGPHERVGRMRPLRLRRPKEGATRRHVAKELMHLDRRTHGPAVGQDGTDPAAVDLQGCARVARRPRADHEPRHLADARERLATEAEGPDPLQILRHPQLARRMRRNGQGEIFRLDTAAVVHDPHEGDAALLEGDVDPSRPRVQRVLEQFLDHAGRPLHHLPGRDPVHHRLGEFLDASHAVAAAGHGHRDRRGPAPVAVSSAGIP